MTNEEALELISETLNDRYLELQTSGEGWAAARLDAALSMTMVIITPNKNVDKPLQGVKL